MNENLPIFRQSQRLTVAESQFGETTRPEPSGHRNMKTATPKNIDQYIAGFPPDVQETLQKIRDIINDAAPDAEETIKYRMPTFVMDGNLVHFAGFEKHIGFYPTPSAIEAFGIDLAGYESAKGSVQFPLDQPVPFALIRSMVEFRVKESCKMDSKKRKK